MKRGFVVWGLLAGLPTAVLAQQDPMERLAEVLPASVRDQVLGRIEAARSRELPEQAMASIALEGVAKGRSGRDILAAVEMLAADMGVAQDALRTAGHQPADGEIEAGTAALRMGVDGESISELARSGPSGRSLAVPLLVLGGLAERGLPSDDALAAVRDRLAARASDAELLRDFPGVGRGLGRGVGPARHQAPSGVPVGPQIDRGRPDGRGRGGGPGN